MTIVISLVCSIIAAFVAHWLATNRMKKNELTKFKLTAYNDFIRSASQLAVSRRSGNTDNDIDELTTLNDAKNRILLSSEHYVVKALIDFWEKGATLEKESELQSYKRLLQSMRTELGFKKYDLFRLEGVSDLLFKVEPSSFSFKRENDEKRI